MDYAGRMRRMIDEINKREQAIWHAFLGHSEEYMEALGLNTDELEVLERGAQKRTSVYPDLVETGGKGFLKFTIEEEEFALAVKHVCGCPYGGKWTESIMAVCISNRNLNDSVGGGTTLINVLPEDWHRKIIHHLTERDEPPSGLTELKKLW